MRKGGLLFMKARKQRWDKSLRVTIILLIFYLSLLPIGYLQADNVDDLIQQLSQEDVYVRMHAAKKLGDIGDARAVQPLIAVIGDEKAGIRAALALVQIGKPSVDPLIVVLKHESPIARRNAAIALGKIGDVRGVNSLIYVLKDNDLIVRRNAAKALGEIRDTSAVEPLIDALTDKVPVVRRYAALALGEIKDKRAVSPLICALGDNDAIVRMNAATALNRMGISDTYSDTYIAYICSHKTIKAGKK
jgi:HEAT repeat protein